MQEATEEELEKLLDKIMVLFRFIHGNVGLGLLFLLLLFFLASHSFKCFILEQPSLKIAGLMHLWDA